MRKILQQGNVYYLDIFVNEVVSSRFYDLGSAAFVRVQVGVGVKFCRCRQESVEQIGEKISRHWFV